MKILFNSPILKKFLVFRLVLGLICPNIALAEPPVTTPHPVVIPKIFIPESYGRIEESQVPGLKSQIILIKDAHCNYEAQTNISKILDILIRDYKIDLVCVEGASGHVNPSIIASHCDDAEIRNKVTDKYLRTGLLTASEALSINKGTEPGFTIWGVEDLKLYLKDYQAFRQNIETNGETNHFVKLLSKLISQLKQKLYPEKLLRFDSEINRYEINEIPLTNFIKFLTLTKPLPAEEYPTLNVVLKSIRLEEKIYFPKVENERSILIKHLEKYLPKEDLRELVKQSLLFKLGKIPQINYYLYLEEYFRVYRETLTAPTENLEKYFELVKLQAQIEEKELFRELEEFQKNIYTDLLPDQRTRQLHQLDKDVKILTKMLHLESTREDFLYYKNNRHKFKPEKLISFIKIQAPINRTSLPPELENPAFLKKVRTALLPSEEFYNLALGRDHALVENLLKTMQKNKKETAVLIVGGFHTEGIKKILLENGISTVVITPSITKLQEDSHELYLARMMDERIDPEMILAKLGLENLQAILAADKIGYSNGLPEPIIGELREFFPELPEIDLLVEQYREVAATNPSYASFLGELINALGAGERIEEHTWPTPLPMIEEETDKDAEETIKRSLAALRTAADPESAEEHVNTLRDIAITGEGYIARLAVFTIETLVLSPKISDDIKRACLNPALTEIIKNAQAESIRHLANNVRERILASPFVPVVIKDLAGAASYRRQEEQSPEPTLPEKRNDGAPTTLKGPGTDKEKDLDRVYFDKLIKSAESVSPDEVEPFINKTIKEINERGLSPDELTAEKVTFHLVDRGKQLGIPKFEGAEKPQDLIYADGRKENGKLHIYVTKAFWEKCLMRYPLMLAFLIDHEWQENVVLEEIELEGRHREASKRAWRFLDEYGMNPFYRFYLQQLASNGQEDELKRLFLEEKEHQDEYGRRFKHYARRLLLGKRQIAEIGIVNEQLKELYKGKTPEVMNLYASPYPGSGVREVVNTFSEIGRENKLDIGTIGRELDSGITNIIKKMRLGLQGEDVSISEEEWENYRAYNKDLERFEQIGLSNTDVLIIHDYEFLGMVPLLKQRYPNLKIIWHCHLDLDNPNQNVWEKIREYANQCDLAILQPRENYQNLYNMLGLKIPARFAPPAIIDPTDDKHRPLNNDEKEEIKKLIEGMKGMKGVDLEETPYFLYTGRIDPQKAIMDTLHTFVEMRKGLPQDKRTKLLIAFPEEDMSRNMELYGGIRGFIERLKRSGETRPIAEDIKLIPLKDDEYNSLILNYLHRNALAGLQLSSREGFGLPVAEMMYKGKPVIGTDVGGIKTQIRHAVTGYLVKPDKKLVENAAEYMKRLVLDPKEATTLGMKAKELARTKYLASNLVLNYLYSIYSVINTQSSPSGPMSIDKCIDHHRIMNIFDTVERLERTEVEETTEIQKGILDLLTEEGEMPDEETLEQISTLMNYFEAMEEMVYDMLSEDGKASCLVLEKLKNSLWQLYREENWDTSIDIMNINLPIGKINTKKGMATADTVKERFFEVLSRYTKEKKQDALHRYGKISGTYGFSKTRMYIVGVGVEDIPEIEELYKDTLLAVGFSEQEIKKFPIYIGHKKLSLKKDKKKLMKLKYNKKENAHKKIDDLLDELVISAFQEVLGMAEFIEKVRKVSGKDFLSDGMLLPWTNRIIRRLGKKKFIPENETETGKFPRINHMIGELGILRGNIQRNGYKKADAKLYIQKLKKALLRGLKDIRYWHSYKRGYIKSVLEKWERGESFLRGDDWTGLELLLAKQGDENWYYIKSGKDTTLSFGELDKCNAFFEAYEADSKDSLYHKVIDWLRINMPEIYEFYRKLYEDPEEITLNDINRFNEKTKFLSQIGIDEHKLWSILQGGEEQKTRIIEQIKAIDIIGNLEITSPKNYRVSTEAAKVKGKWRRVKLVKSKPLAKIKKGKTCKIKDLPFHSSDKVRINGQIQRLKLYEMKDERGEIRRFVVYNYRIYTATGKGEEDEEDITEEILSHRDKYEFSPVETTLGITLTLDRTNLLNLSQDAISNYGAYHKKHMKVKVADVSETVAHQIISILEQHGVTGISQKQIAETIINADNEKIDFINLWNLINERIEPEEFFEIAGEISEPINELLGPEAHSKGAQVMAAVLREILKTLPYEEREKILKKGRTTERTLLKVIKHIVRQKGIDPAAVQSVFDLFKQGIDILTMDPELDDDKIDGSYFVLIKQLADLTDISQGAILNAFKDNFARDFSKFRISDGQIIERSLLWKEAKRLERYNNYYKEYYEGHKTIPEKGNNLNDQTLKDLWDLLFTQGKDTKNTYTAYLEDSGKHDLSLYLSALDVVSKDVKNIIDALRGTPARSAIESKTTGGVICNVEDCIQIQEIKDDGTPVFSYKPGAETIFKQMDEGVKIAFSTENIPEEERQYYGIALKATGRFDKNVFIADNLEKAQELLLGKGIKNSDKIVYLAQDKEGAKKAKKLGLKSIIITKDSAFHAALVFAILYARVGPVLDESGKLNPEVRTLIWHFLKIMDYEDKETRKVIKQLQKKGFFTVKLIRIKDTLEEFQNRRISIEVAA